MNRIATTALVQNLMLDFARQTGLSPAQALPRRYLWTDAFAVCNYLELFSRTGDQSFRNLALALVDQVHQSLGRHRSDDSRGGWISGLDDEQGQKHPTIGGLRIGKKLRERGPMEPADERLEWDRDGQYYHYLTKWMHALHCVSRSTGDTAYARWAVELARIAHARFTYQPPSGGRKRMHWKMSIDLTYPLVPAMGQHDPLDGLVTYCELQGAATGEQGGGTPGALDLGDQISDMVGICQGIHLATDDPLGIGGLLFDASRISQLMMQGGCRGGLDDASLLDRVLASALQGTEDFSSGRTLELPGRHRLAFRELGLSIGISAVEDLRKRIEENPGIFGRERSLSGRIDGLMEYLPLRERIEEFWMDEVNRTASTWTEHREINTAMLATSLAPARFLTI